MKNSTIKRIIQGILFTIVLIACGLDTADAEDFHIDTWLESKPTAGLTFQFGGWSNHIGVENSGDIFNERHQMLGVQYKHAFAARFKNSFGEETYAVGVTYFDRIMDDSLEIGIKLGAHYGYRACMPIMDDKYYTQDKKLCPLVVPTVSYTKYRVQPSLLLLGNAAVLSFRVEF